MKYCRKCGAMLNDTAMFCKNCGTQCGPAVNQQADTAPTAGLNEGPAPDASPNPGNMPQNTYSGNYKRCDSSSTDNVNIINSINNANYVNNANNANYVNNANYRAGNNYTSGGQAPRTGNNKALIIIIIILLIAAAGAAIYFFVLKKDDTGKAAKSETKEESVIETEYGDEDALEEDKSASADNSGSESDPAGNSAGDSGSGSDSSGNSGSGSDGSSSAEKEKLPAVTIERTLENLDSGRQKATFIGKDINGGQVWTYEAAPYQLAELDCCEVIGINGDTAYITDNGDVVALSALTGEALWRYNAGIGGCTSAFDSEGNLYVCGYYGSELLKLTPQGMLAFSAPFGDRYWPFNISTDGVEVRVEFEGEHINGESSNIAYYNAKTGESLTVNTRNTVHHYDLVVSDETFDQAMRTAASRGGYLANIETKEEFDRIIDQIYAEGKEKKHFKVGAAIYPGTSEYHWIDSNGNFTDTVVNAPDYWINVYGLWPNGEPSYSYNGYIEDKLSIFLYKGKWSWNDVPGDVLAEVPGYAGIIGYIIEYDY